MMDNSCDQAEFLTRTWMDWMSKMATAGLSVQPTAPPPEAARQMRGGVLQAMSQCFEQVMRSPEMLEWMKRSMDGAIDFRKQYNDVMTRMRHDTQGTTSEDVDNLMQTVRHLETRVLSRLDEVSDRLEAIAGRLDRLESAKQASSNGHNVSGARGTRQSRKSPSKVGKSND